MLPLNFGNRYFESLVRNISSFLEDEVHSAPESTCLKPPSRYTSTIAAHPDAKEEGETNGFFGKLGKRIFDKFDQYRIDMEIKEKPKEEPMLHEEKTIEASFGLVLLQKKDGNCVYRSIGRGLCLLASDLKKNQKWDLEGISDEKLHEDLRSKTIAWMRAAYDRKDAEFLSYLTATIVDAIPSFNVQLKHDVQTYTENVLGLMKLSKEGYEWQREKALELLPNRQRELKIFQMILGTIEANGGLMTPETYLLQASRDRFFAGLAEVYALCQMYGFDAFIYQVDHNHQEIPGKDRLKILGSGKARPVITLEFIGGDHYNTVIALQ